MDVPESDLVLDAIDGETAEDCGSPDPASWPPAFSVSLAVHVVMLTALAVLKITSPDGREDFAIDTAIKERTQEEFSKVLEDEIEIAETMNTVSMAVAVSTAIGLTGRPTESQQTIENPNLLAELEFAPNEISLPGETSVDVDLGQDEVAGETGAIVEGYGAALSRLTQELIRMMKKQRVLVVWMFDQSLSMKDDRQEIRQQLHKVYRELGIAQRDDARLPKGKEILRSAVWMYGEKAAQLLGNPSANIDEVLAAIEDIESAQIDESGKENTCEAMRLAIEAYRPLAVKQKRRLVVIVVTDESGDDGEQVEETIAAAKHAHAPVYILGRESIFGYPYATVKWQSPMSGLYYVRINRGPETAFPECMQWDGFTARGDNFSAGFGPYEQVRIAKETGGIFFVLPGEEEELPTPEAQRQRQFDFLDMKVYEPLLLTRREYEEHRNLSEFRSTIWHVILKLNPYLDEQLKTKGPGNTYSLDFTEFERQSRAEFPKAVRGMMLLNQAVELLDRIRSMRAKEKSQRWRANYDLLCAQCRGYRVRLFQFLLTLDRHLKSGRKPVDPQTQVWKIRHTPKMLPPDAEQVRLTRVDVEELQQQESQARDSYQSIINEHPRTPWAQRAAWELRYGFGLEFVEYRVSGEHSKDWKPAKVPNF